VNGPAGSILPGPFIVLDVQVRAQPHMLALRFSVVW